MRYFGGKQRIAGDLAAFLASQLEQGQVFVDLICGSCNVVSRIPATNPRMANDVNKELVSLFVEVCGGWDPPEEITEEMYAIIKCYHPQCRRDEALRAFVGFGCSFAGKWWGGYARGSATRNYASNARNSLLKKAARLSDVVFSSVDYSCVNIPDGSLVYCDIPYKNITGYSCGEFNHDRFYSWVGAQENCRVLISECQHNMPNNATLLWSKDSKQDVRSSDGSKKATREVLFELTKWEAE